MPGAPHTTTTSTLHHPRARLLKATFLVLTKQLREALEELTGVVEEAGEDTRALINALIKRGSLYIQRCHEPTEVTWNSIQPDGSLARTPSWPMATSTGRWRWSPPAPTC